MKNVCKLLLMVAIISFASCKKSTEPEAPVYDDVLTQNLRTAAAAIPGSLPESIHYIKYASSIKKWSDVIEGGSDDPCTMARTAFQIVYPDGFIMVDAGMDRSVYRFFEKDGPQPFDDSLAQRVALSLQQARLILITHEHADHVAGVIQNANNTIPPKTILTDEQVQTLIDDPQLPEIKLDEKRSRQYIVTGLQSVLPVAPGVALIKSPGHTNGEIMVYAKLQNGKEYIFSGDVTWSFKGIQDKKQKPKAERKRLGENEKLIGQQINWLNDRLNKDKMIILVSHDDVMLPQYAAQGFIENGFK